MDLLTTAQVKEIEARGKAALAQLGPALGLEFDEYGNGNYQLKRGTICYGILITDVRKKSGIVRVTWRPDIKYNNYAYRRKLSYDATDEVDNDAEFLAWIMGIKTDLEI